MSLRIARKIAKLSQSELARRSEVEHATISRLENGLADLRKAPYPTVAAIASVLNLTPAELIQFMAPPSAPRKRGTPPPPAEHQAASR